MINENAICTFFYCVFTLRSLFDFQCEIQYWLQEPNHGRTRERRQSEVEREWYLVYCTLHRRNIIQKLDNFVHIIRIFSFLGQPILFFISFFITIISNSYVNTLCWHFHSCRFGVFDSNELNREEIVVFCCCCGCGCYSGSLLFVDTTLVWIWIFLKIFVFSVFPRFRFASFVQEFVAAPLDGVSLLLEVLRSIQLSQQTTINQDTIGKVTAQTYQRRALLDELACL